MTQFDLDREQTIKEIFTYVVAEKIIEADLKNRIKARKQQTAVYQEELIAKTQAIDISISKKIVVPFEIGTGVKRSSMNLK